MARLPFWKRIAKGVTHYGRFGEPLDVTTNGSGELRVTSGLPLLTIKQVDLAPDSLIVKSSGTVTHDPALSLSVLSGSAILQSAWYVDYQPSRPQVIEITYSPIAGTMRAGYYDANDGLLLELVGTTPKFISRSYGADLDIPRANWNVDKLDGDGPSKLTADFSTFKRAFFRFAWLGIGPAEFGFIHRGVPVVCHRQVFDDDITAPFMRTPSLPLRWETVGTGSSMRAVCGVVKSEGGQALLGVPGAAERLAAAGPLAAGTYEVASIRLAGTARTTVFPGAASLALSSNDGGIARLLLNPTFTGAASWAASGGSAAVQHNISVAPRPITAAGRVLASAPFSVESRARDLAIDPILPLTRDIAGTADILTLALTLSSTATVAAGALNYRVVP